MAKTVRLSDIAARLGVSTVTVSKAISGEKGVSASLREKIIKTAEDMGYIPVERKDDSNGGYCMGVLVAERYLGGYDSFYLQIYKQISMKAASKKCFAFMEVISGAAEKNGDIPALVKEDKAKGIIVLGRVDEKYLNTLKERDNIPIIYMDFADPTEETDCIISDSYYGAYRLTHYLMELGHKKIAYVGTLRATGSITDRYMGYLRAHLEHGINPKSEWIIDDRDLVRGSINPGEHMVLPKEMPTAFVCNCDMAAAAIIGKLNEKGYRVPEDVSVVGYDNYIYPGACQIGITTYEVDIKEMARRAVKTMLKKLEGDGARPKVSIVEGHLVMRDSVAKPRI